MIMAVMLYVGWTPKLVERCSIDVIIMHYDIVYHIFKRVNALTYSYREKSHNP